MKKLLRISFILLSSLVAHSQVNLDSLWMVWNDPVQSDTSRLKAIHSYAWNGYLFTEPDSAFYFAQLEYDYAQSKGLKKQMAAALNVQGITYYIQGESSEAINYYTKCLNTYKEISDREGQAIATNNIGNIYYDEGHYDQAIEYYSQSLKFEEELDNKEGISASLSNIAMIYDEQKDFNLAMEYYSESLKLEQEIDNKVGIASTYNNIGVIYQKQENYDLALEYYSNSLMIYEEIEDQTGIASALSNVGLISKIQGDIAIKEGVNVLADAKYAEALDHYNQCLKIYNEIDNSKGVAITYNYIGAVYFEKKDYHKAFEYNNKSLNIAQEMGFVSEIKSAAQSLWEVYKKKGNYKAALEMHELYLTTRDSIESEENQKAVIQQQFKYEYDKKVAADSVKAMEETKVQEALLAAEKAETEKQKVQVKQQEQQKYYLFGGLALALLFGGFVFNRFRVTSKQKDIIEEQKSVVELQKTEVESQKKELELTHQQLEEHHKEIADSIMYAKRIQEAIMPSMTSMDAALKDGFVLYLPKDVVAGDFFWMEQVDDVTYYAAADCTGHGVPGAMVSVVCSNALNKALLEEGIRGTGELLDRTREIVIDRLAKSGEEVKDGMDISLCALNLKTKELRWAGANNPLWILRKETQEFEEIKANKQPIGKYADPMPFTEHVLSLNEGDTIYVFTDGYQDQFGGPKGKKLKAKLLKDILLESQSISMDDQMKLLQKKFMEWKGEIEQIDDVCIIGVRV